MARLIDADVVIKHIEEYWEMVKRGKPSRGMTAVMQNIKTIVNSLPTVDAEPVKRGMWTVIRLTNKDYDAKECSSCGSTFFNTILWHYCPHCGARMDK